jgi:hypothetical protein
LKSLSRWITLVIVHRKFFRTSGPMGEVLAPLAQVPRKTREKEVGGGGVTTQADRVQHCTAQGTPGKICGVHG